jgi:hypothetical protein
MLGRLTALAASLLLGVLWAGWHLPLLWTEGSAVDGTPVWLLFVDLPAKAVLFTWVFLRTRGSVLLAALLHGSTNLFVVSPSVDESGDLTLALTALAAKWLLVFGLVAYGGRQLGPPGSRQGIGEPISGLPWHAEEHSHDVERLPARGAADHRRRER